MKVNLSKVNIQLQLCSRVLVLGKKKRKPKNSQPYYFYKFSRYF